MNPTKSILFIALALILAAGAVTGLKFSEAVRTKTAITELRVRQQEAAARIAALESRLRTETKHAEAAEADNALLAEALKQAQLAQERKVAKAAEPVKREAVEERFKRAQLLVKNGDPSEALRELLGCLEGYRKLGGAMRTRVSMVLLAIGELGKRSPEALAMLREQRDILRKQVLAGPGGSDAISDFAAVVHALKDDQAMLDLYDEVPKGDRRRSTMGIYAFEQLLATKRYANAAEGRPYASMRSSFEMNTAERPLPPSTQNPERIRESTRNYAIATAGKNIEVLAGAGDVAHARTLIDRLLAYDSSEGTNAMLRERLERAGHPELLDGSKP